MRPRSPLLPLRQFDGLAHFCMSRQFESGRRRRTTCDLSQLIDFPEFAPVRQFDLKWRKRTGAEPVRQCASPPYREDWRNWSGADGPGADFKPAQVSTSNTARGNPYWARS